MAKKRIKDIRTKIIATVGPSCSTVKRLQKLVNSGVSCFRVNLSHGTREEKINFFDVIKNVKLSTGHRPAILADLAGPKIRVDTLNKPLAIKKGDSVKISNENIGDNIVPVSKNIKFHKVNKGAKILIDDGKISLEVISHISDSTLSCIAMEDGIIESKKGVNFPGVGLDLPVLTEQDINDLRLSLEKGADWIALSFVRWPSDYNFINTIIDEMGYKIPVMAKIEQWEAVENLNDIIDTFDAVMVARGDLGVEMPIEQVPIIQNRIVKIARATGKPVVIATQILDSMTERPVPTRAEVSDIANSILDGADALMVTGETAVGNHPKKVIKVLKKVIKETEASVSNQIQYNIKDNNQLGTSQAISHAACSVALDQRINILVTMTHTGSTARMASRYRPAAKIIAMTPFRKICRQLLIVWGVHPILVQEYFSSDEIPAIVDNKISDYGLLEKGEKYVITGGVPVGVPGTTNYLSVLRKN